MDRAQGAGVRGRAWAGGRRKSKALKIGCGGGGLGLGIGPGGVVLGRCLGKWFLEVTGRRLLRSRPSKTMLILQGKKHVV